MSDSESTSGSESDIFIEVDEDGAPFALRRVAAVAARATVAAAESSYEPVDASEPNKALSFDGDLVAVNDAHRRPDVPDGEGSDLWSIEQLAAAAAVTPRTGAVFAPVSWPGAKRITQAEYSRSFKGRSAIASQVLPMANVVVAGGAAAWPLGTGAACPGSDVDFFVYGVDPSDQAALWRVVATLVQKICKAALKKYRCVSQRLSKGVVTLLAHNIRRGESAATEKLQIILRAYPSISSILHAFDVPSAAVAFDGHRAYTTTLGAYAHACRVNPVVPAYRSTTYEARLAKYFERGYALELPGLDRRLLAAPGRVELPHLTLAVDVVCHERVDSLEGGNTLAAGTLVLPPGTPAAGSDYDREPVTPTHSYWFDSTIRTVETNAYRIATGHDNFVVVGQVTNERRSSTALPIPFQDYVAKGSPMLSDLISRFQLEKALDRHAKAATLGYIGVVINFTPLRKIFGLTEAEIARLIEAVTETRRLNPGKRLTVAAALAQRRRAIIDRYSALPDVVQWWITQDPGRQYTASVDPRMENAAEWYGAAFTEAPSAPTSDELLARFRGACETWAQLPAAAKPKKPVYASPCPLCHCDITPGDANTIVLDCGHVFHAIFDDDCPGLLPWVSKGKLACPTCRSKIVTKKTTPEVEKIQPRPREAIEVAVRL